MLLPSILTEVCLRTDCKERCSLPERKQNRLRFITLIKALVFVLAGMLIGSGISVRLHGQSSGNSSSSNSSKFEKLDPQTIILTTKVSMMDVTLNSLMSKVDHLQSEADTTEAMGAGIGVAITFLQLLGFLAARKERL
jgi:hypothetical protein